MKKNSVQTRKNRPVVHISTVHSALDPRIRLKQLRSIVEAGMKVYFISGDPATEDIEDGVHVIRIASVRPARLRRMLILAPKAIWVALRTPACIYHLHDPELLPWAWLLLLRRVPIFYDIHEDYSLAMQKKYYLPKWSRPLIGGGVAFLEKLFSLPFQHIIAEYAYAKRFPRATPILNYPTRKLLEEGSSLNLSPLTERAQLLYTGYITVERGALNLARLVRDLPDVEVTMVGKCFPEVVRRIEEVAGEGMSRLSIVGKGRFVPFQEILSHYYKKKWTAGIVLIPDISHFKEKHLTKFFEFMALGLPIIASDFPVWRELIEKNGVGYCVNPNDHRAVGSVLTKLRADPVETREMGRRGRALVRTKYNWEHQALRLVDLYQSRIVE